MEPVGYRSPPHASRFKKGRSGNPRGRPRNRHSTLPYETVLGHSVTIREDGRERRVGADEAFLLHITRKGLMGDSAAARASLDAIEAARASRGGAHEALTVTICLVGSGLGSALETLGVAIKTDRADLAKVRYWLKPWVVEAALARLGPRHLTPEDQREVWGATQTPTKVRWPAWWTERRSTEGKVITRTPPDDFYL